jgi:hypothetical protein
MNNTNKSKTEGTKGVTPERKPNEVGGFYFSSGLKIFDPISKEVIVQKRGDI